MTCLIPSMHNQSLYNEMFSVINISYHESHLIYPFSFLSFTFLVLSVRTIVPALDVDLSIRKLSGSPKTFPPPYLLYSGTVYEWFPPYFILLESPLLSITNESPVLNVPLYQ